MTMKRIIFLTIGMALTLLTGCVVMSVYPYYTAKDVVFDPTLLGVWTDATKTNGDGESWTFEKVEEQKYQLVITENDKKTKFDACLFKIKNHLFLDCLAHERCDYSAPCHLLLRVDQLQPTLEMRLLNFDWLTKLLERQPKAIRHTIIEKAGGQSDSDKILVLTADTAELQKFILKQLETKEAWSDVMVMQRQ
jgi:hypothetical protein